MLPGGSPGGGQSPPAATTPRPCCEEPPQGGVNKALAAHCAQPKTRGNVAKVNEALALWGSRFHQGSAPAAAAQGELCWASLCRSV